MAERYEHDDNHEYDILCVGFGPAGLSIAITLAEAEGVSKNGQSEKLSQEDLRVCFVEKQPTFIWHEGMLLDDSKMQISFLKDLASMRDPRSYYTFLNYLHQKDRLLAFSNLGSFYPYRAEYNDYMAWAASHFTDVCRFGEQVVAIEPIVSEDTQEVERLKVTSKRLADDVNVVRIAKNVVVAVGGQPRIPDLVTSNSDQEFEYNHRIIHSSQYAYRVSKTLSDKDAPYSIAVVGGGQSGAEIFYDLTNRYPNSRVSLILRDTALRPSDDSPFVNEIFDPSFTNTFYNMPTEKRQATLKREKATNYSVVRIELIERIYALLYKQKLPGQSEQHNILHSRRVLTVDPSEDSITLKLVSTDDSELNQENGEAEQSFDAVFFATGYQRRLHKEILRPMESYLTTDENSQMIIQRDYRVLTDPKCRAGIYLQGCCENTHGLSDSLLSVLPVRGVEVVQSLIEHDTGLDRSSSTKSTLEKELTSALQINGGKHGVDRYKSETCDLLPSPPSTRPLTPSTEDQMWQWVDGVDSNNANFGCLRYCGPSVDQVVSQDQNRAHPTRVPRPSSGQMLYRRHISALGQTVSFRVADMEHDVEHLHKWMNDPRVSKFWGEDGPIEHQRNYLSTILSDEHVIPVIGSFDNESFAYFEIYWSKEDRLGGYYTAEDFDRGIHMLVGEQKFRGPHRVEAWLPSLAHYLLLDDSRTQRVVSEPRSDNDKMIGYLQEYGFERHGDIQLPHKRAALMILPREHFFQTEVGVKLVQSIEVDESA